MNKEKKYVNISPEKFKLVRQDAKISDVKFDTKPIGYFKDAFIRFKKNKDKKEGQTRLIVFALFLYIISGFIGCYWSKNFFGN